MRRSIFIVIILTASFIWADVFTELNTARIAYFNEQDYERARAACLRGIELAAGHFELHVILGGSEMGLANWQAAASVFEKDRMDCQSKRRGYVLFPGLLLLCTRAV